MDVFWAKIFANKRQYQLNKKINEKKAYNVHRRFFCMDVKDARSIGIKNLFL